MNNALLSNIDLTGVIDMHIHTAPDVRPRYCDDIQAAQEAKDAGMQAILLKSHITITADRAAIAEKVVQGIRVFGGIVLNSQVGGLNPAAVEAALKMGAKEIWMPTSDAMNEKMINGLEGGISIFAEDKKIKPEVHEILDLIHSKDSILATAHLSVEEIIALVEKACAMGLRKILITHPDSPLIRMPISTQIQLAEKGVYFERCFVDTTPLMKCFTSIREIASVIRKVGINSTILTTDFGVASLPPPVQGMKQFIYGLTQENMSKDEIQVMVKDNPANMLGL